MTTTPIQPTTTTRSFAARVPLAIVSVGAVIAGAVVTTGFELLARAADVGLEAASTPSATPAPIPVGGFFGGVVFWGAFGIVLSLVLARYAKRPRSTWNKAAWALTVVSLTMPMVVAADSLVTNITLALSHLVAAAVIIPLIATRLSETNPRR